MGVHVDDVVIGGRGQVFDKKLQQLRSTFPFRKWQEGQGTFCGSFLQQNPETGGISVSQRDFIDKMQKPKLRTKDPASMEVNDEEVTSLKSCLGAALWLARETRPDLSVQVSQGHVRLWATPRQLAMSSDGRNSIRSWSGGFCRSRSKGCGCVCIQMRLLETQRAKGHKPDTLLVSPMNCYNKVKKQYGLLPHGGHIG